MAYRRGDGEAPPRVARLDRRARRRDRRASRDQERRRPTPQPVPEEPRALLPGRHEAGVRTAGILERVNLILFQNHLERYVSEAVSSGWPEAFADELLEALRYTRRPGPPRRWPRR